jgi:hypothetical protein
MDSAFSRLFFRFICLINRLKGLIQIGNVTLFFPCTFSTASRIDRYQYVHSARISMLSSTQWLSLATVHSCFTADLDALALYLPGIGLYDTFAYFSKVSVFRG